MPQKEIFPVSTQAAGEGKYVQETHCHLQAEIKSYLQIQPVSAKIGSCLSTAGQEARVGRSCTQVQINVCKTPSSHKLRQGPEACDLPSTLRLQGWDKAVRTEPTEPQGLLYTEKKP